MPQYELRYFSAGAPQGAVDRVDCAGDGEARARAISGLLRLSHRDAVEVWKGESLLYSRHRGALQAGLDRTTPGSG